MSWLEEFGEHLGAALDATAEMLRKGADLVDDLAMHAEGSLRDGETLEKASAWARAARATATANRKAAAVAREKLTTVEQRAQEGDAGDRGPERDGDPVSRRRELTLIGGGTRRYTRRKRVPLAGKPDMSTGFTTVDDGDDEATFKVYVDLGRLLDAVGRKAWGSAKKVTKLRGGAVEVRCVATKRLS